jgi:hypothetical protein
VWAGMVEVFELHGHPKATHAYAWAHETDSPEFPIRHVTVFRKVGRPKLPKGEAKGRGI